MKDAIYSDHALQEMSRRKIEKELVLQIITNPDTAREVRPGRMVYQKTLIAQPHQKPLLYRLFVDIDRSPAVIVTVYATSKFAKYEAVQ
jgi:hypothetical protein